MEVIRMKRKFVCTKEMPLSEQVDVNEQTEMSEIVVSGYLGGKDLMLLSNMSQGGNLLILDMSGVTELDTDGMDGTIESTPFCDDNGLEEVYLPDIDKLIYPMFYNCTNLKRVDFPSSIKHLDAFLARTFGLIVTVCLILIFALWEVGNGSFLITMAGLKTWRIYNPSFSHLMGSFILFPMVDVSPSIVIRQEMKGRILIFLKVFTR